MTTQYIYDLTDTWNAGGTVFNAIKMNVTNSASAAGSKLIDLQIGGTTLFNVDKSGNVGIGTASPSSRLQVVSAATGMASFSGPEYAQIRHSDGTRTLFTSVYNNAAQIGTESSTPLLFVTNNTERARIDTSGNVGIGVTPVNLYTPGKVLQINSGGPTIYGSSTTSSFSSNINIDAAGNNLYQTSNFAAAYFQVSGQHRWFTAPSGTAGNTITFTQIMTLDASGNLGIGTTSPAQKLHVATAGSNYIVSHNTAGSTSALLLGAESGKTGIYSWTTVGGATGVPLTFTTGATESMRLTEQGGLLVGATATTGYKFIVYTADGTFPASGDTSASYALISGASRTGTSIVSSSYATTLVLQSNTDSNAAGTGASLGFQAKWDSGNYPSAAQFASIFGGKENSTLANLSGYLSFATRPNGGVPTERMRITSTGNVSIGTTSNFGALTVSKGAAGDEVARFHNAGGFGIRIIPQVGGSGGKTAIRTAAGESISLETNTTERMLVDATGNVIINTAAIATNATDGFLYVPSCAGTPTGTPTAYAGRVPIVVDTTNNKLYFYSGGAWRDAGP